MGHLEVAHVDYYPPDGRLLLADASGGLGVMPQFIGSVRETPEPVWDEARVKRAR